MNIDIPNRVHYRPGHEADCFIHPLYYVRLCNPV